MGQLKIYEAEKHTIVLRTATGRRKLFKVQFSKRDGSLFVHTPYYRECDGIVTLVTLPAGKYSNTKVSLINKGKITSRKVKYSHHPDGNVLFSQDSQVISSIRRKSTPLNGSSKHLFTILLQGPADFEVLLNDTPLRRSCREYDHILPLTTSAHAYKFIGEWVSEKRFEQHLPQRDVGPVVCVGNAKERADIALLLGGQCGFSPDKRILMLTCETIPQFNQSEKSCIILYGGFDPTSITTNPLFPTSFLVMSYPASSPEELWRQIGTIDL